MQFLVSYIEGGFKIMAVLDEKQKQRIIKLVEKVKKFEAQKAQLEAISKEKSRTDKTNSNSFYGQYEN